LILKGLCLALVARFDRAERGASLELESCNAVGCRWKEKLQPGCRTPNAVIYNDKYARRRQHSQGILLNGEK
jgi:hypothetical protein